jgi:hypothetical protein
MDFVTGDEAQDGPSRIPTPSPWAISQTMNRTWPAELTGAQFPDVGDLPVMFATQSLAFAVWWDRLRRSRT